MYNEYGLRLNIENTKVMFINKTPDDLPPIIAFDRTLQRIERLSYLDCNLYENWRPERLKYRR